MPNGQGGFGFDSDLKFTCLLSQFGDNLVPSAQAKAMLNTFAVYLGNVYRIDGVVTASGGLQLEIELMDANQGI